MQQINIGPVLFVVLIAVTAWITVHILRMGGPK